MPENNYSSIYLSQGRILLVGNQLDNGNHSHYALQITVSLDQSPYIVNYGDQSLKTRFAFIAPNEPHFVDQEKIWRALILINPESQQAKAIARRYFTEAPVASIDSKIIDACEAVLKPFTLGVPSIAEAGSAIDQILELVTPEAPPLPQIDPRVQAIFDHIGNELHEELGVDELADYIGLSSSRLSHLFKDKTGLSLKRYLLWHKVYRAGFMIGAGLSMTDAAAFAGFADAPHFTRAFKQMFGMTPSQILKPSNNVRIIADDTVAGALMAQYNRSINA